jgi:hypothetical protein
MKETIKRITESEQIRLAEKGANQKKLKKSMKVELKVRTSKGHHFNKVLL